MAYTELCVLTVVTLVTFYTAIYVIPMSSAHAHETHIRNRFTMSQKIEDVLGENDAREVLFTEIRIKNTRNGLSRQKL